MRYFLPLALLLAFQFYSPAIPQKKESDAGRPPAKARHEASAAPLVCIDPGHPSEVSSGGVLQNGTTEVHIAWEVALKLRGLLEERGYRVVLTKESEPQVVENRSRAIVANEAKAALMLRLHCDASTDRGYAVYYPDRQGTAQGTTGPTREVREASRRAAEAIHAGMRAGLDGALKDGGVRGDSQTLVGSKQGALTGSVFSQVPVVTVEMVVLSDASDAAFIKAGEGQRRMAEAIADGIERFIPLTPAASPRGVNRK